MTQPKAQGKTGKGCFSAQRKTQAAVRLLQGEALDTLSQELGVTAARLSEWRDEFLAAGEAGLKSRQPDSRDQQIRELQAKVDELTMDLEASREVVSRLKVGRPYGAGEVELMSRACSIVTGKSFGVARVCREWGNPPAPRFMPIVTAPHSRHSRRPGGTPTRPTPMRS